MVIGALGKFTEGASTILSSSEASLILLPRLIGDFIFPQLGHSGHTLGLDSSKVVQRYGPFVRSIFFIVSRMLYSGWFSDILRAAFSPSSQKLAIDNPALHRGSDIPS